MQIQKRFVAASGARGLPEASDAFLRINTGQQLTHLAIVCNL